MAKIPALQKLTHMLDSLHLIVIVFIMLMTMLREKQMVGDHWSLTRFATLATTSFPVVLLSSPSVVYEGNYFDPFFPFILWQNDPKYGNL